MHTFITNKLKKKSYHSVFFSLIVMTFFPLRGDLFLEQYVNLNAH